MGMFSSKRTVTVSAQTMHLMEAPKDPWVSTVLGAVVREDSIPMALLNFIHSSLSVSIPHIYNYARDEYTLGLPQGQALNNSYVDLAYIETILLQEFGGVPLLRCEGAAFMNISPTIAAYPFLYGTRQWNQFTNLVETPPVGIVWQQDPTEGSINMATVRKEVHLKSATVAANGVSIDLVYALLVERPVAVSYPDPSFENNLISAIEMQFIEEPYTFAENIPYMDAPTITWGEEFLVAIYRAYVNDLPVGLEKAWIYRISSGTYPSIGINGRPLPDEYFPVIPLRYENVDMFNAAHAVTPLYITSKKLAKIGKMDLNLLAEKLNANPNIAEIDHAYVMYGINIRTEIPACLMYLHSFFQQLYEVQYSSKLDYLDSLGTVPLFGTSPINSVSSNSPTSTFEEHGLLVFLDYDYVTSDITPGVVGNGKLWNVSKEFVEYSEEVKYSSLIYTTVNKALLILKLQIAKNVIHTIKVYGLEHRNLIYEGRSEVTSLLDVVKDKEENNLVIPLQFKLIRDMTLRNRMSIFPEAVLMIVNTYQITVGKWYQSTWFQIIMVIVAVVLIVICLIIPGLQWLSGVIAKGLTVALALEAAITVLTMVAVSVAAKYLVRTFGAKLGIIATIVLLVVAAVLSQGTGTVGMVNTFVIYTAQISLQLSAAIISSSNEFLIEAGEKIKNEYADFQTDLKDRYKELKTETDLLDLKADVDPLIFVRPARLKIVPNESPDQFYSRCLGLPAYTMSVTHDQIPSYFDRLLKLPVTLGNNTYTTTT